MRKLKLESLEVQSFVTPERAAGLRGTVAAHQDILEGGDPFFEIQANTRRNCPPQTYNIEVCGDTNYFDCTLGCSVETNCFCEPVA